MGTHLEDSGLLLNTSAGVTPDTVRGGLTSSGTPTNIGSTVVVDSIIASAVDSNGGTTSMYLTGSEGHLYSLDIGTTPQGTPTDRRSATPITEPTNGLFVYQPRGGTKYLYYVQDTQVGRWDLSGSYPTGWTDNWQTGLEDFRVHPSHNFFDRVYIGNKDRLAEVRDDGAGGVTFSTNVLDFPSDYYASTIDDDGVYLIVGLNRQTSSGSPGTIAGTKVVFWDLNSDSWVREWDFPDSAYLTSIRKVGTVMYALCADGIYAFTFSSPPQIVVAFTGNIVPGFTASASGNYDDEKMIKYRDGVMFTTDVGIHFYGKLRPEFPRAFYTLSTRPSASTILVRAVQSQIYAGGEDKLYYWLPAGIGNTDASAKTVYIPFEETYKIERIDVIFTEPLGSGDSLQVQVKSDEDQNYTTFGTASHTNFGSVRKIELYKTDGAYLCENLSLALNFNGGSPKLKKVIVYGTPLKD